MALRKFAAARFFAGFGAEILHGFIVEQRIDRA